MNRRIRVAHLVTNFAIGGAQDYLLTIVRSLDHSKFEPYIFGCMEGARVEMLQELEGIKYYDVTMLSREISPWKDLLALFQIRKLCKKLSIDILHTHSSKPGVVGRLGGTLAGVKVIVHTIHGFSFHDFMSWRRKRLFVLLEQIMSCVTTALLLVSNRDREKAVELKIRAKRFVQTIYNGVDFTPFEKTIDRTAFRSSIGFGETDIIIGFSGRFSQQKALHILIEAFSIVHIKFPGTKLLLVGDGELRAELLHFIRKLNIENDVVMTGFQNNLGPYFQIMDLFVMTSLWEGLSRSLAEAMYAQLPIVATDVGGTADAIRNNETGWLIPANNVQATVEAILDAIENPQKSQRLATNAYHWARTQFDINVMNKKIEDLYIDLIDQKSIPPIAANSVGKRISP